MVAVISALGKIVTILVGCLVCFPWRYVGGFLLMIDYFCFVCIYLWLSRQAPDGYTSQRRLTVLCYQMVAIACVVLFLTVLAMMLDIWLLSTEVLA